MTFKDFKPLSASGLPFPGSNGASGTTAASTHARKVAFVGLIIVQVTIGIVYKLSQSNGHYTYNPASALVVAEFFKLLISVFMTMRTYSKVWSGTEARVSRTAPTKGRNRAGRRDSTRSSAGSSRR